MSITRTHIFDGKSDSHMKFRMYSIPGNGEITTGDLVLGRMPLEPGYEYKVTIKVVGRPKKNPPKL